MKWCILSGRWKTVNFNTSNTNYDQITIKIKTKYIYNALLFTIYKVYMIRTENDQIKSGTFNEFFKMIWRRPNENSTSLRERWRKSWNPLNPIAEDIFKNVHTKCFRIYFPLHNIQICSAQSITDGLKRSKRKRFEYVRRTIPISI